LNSSSIALDLEQGIAFHRQGDLREARACYSQVLRIQGDHPQALHLMGMICIAEEDYAQAVTLILHVLQGQPMLAASHFNLGIAYKGLEQFDDAVVAFRSALLIAPDDPDIHYSLGNALQAQPDMPAAIIAYRQALALAPQHADAHNNLGVALESLLHLDDALAAYRKALAIRPDHPEACNNLGSAMQDQGEMTASSASYARAIASQPEYAEARWGLAMCGLPAVCSMQDSLAESRTGFAEALEMLETWLTPQRLGSAAIVGAKQPFYLAYQDENNRALLSRYGDLCVRLMQRWQPHDRPTGISSDTRLKVGIVSAHIHDHSVWNAIVRSWLQHLDSMRFSLAVFHLGDRQDAETEFARTRAQYFGTRQNLDAWVETLREHQPDVLIYPEIGMDAMTLQLACLRLAPVQIAAWGHPETSGLSTMDFYLSAQAFETAGAQDNYREKLIALPNLGCCYAALPVAAISPDMAALGIAEDRPLLLCAGTPFKYGPAHDHVFVALARELKACQFVFFTHSIPNLSDRLQLRLKQRFDEAGLDFERYCRFIPWQRRAAFYGVMARADVMLDTIGFSGFNTAMQAMECGLPVVTREGRFMRGNLASGILRRAGLPDLVAVSDEDYIAITLRLVRDAAYGQSVRDRIDRGRSVLFDDLAPIRALEDFLLAAARH